MDLLPTKNHAPAELPNWSRATTHLGAEHRLHLRAVFLLGQAHAQHNDHPSATTAYERALAGQETGRAVPLALAVDAMIR